LTVTEYDPKKWENRDILQYGNAVETYLDTNCSNLGRDTACPVFLVYPLSPGKFWDSRLHYATTFSFTSCKSAVHYHSGNERYYWQT